MNNTRTHTPTQQAYLDMLIAAKARTKDERAMSLPARKAEPKVIPEVQKASYEARQRIEKIMEEKELREAIGEW